jgi:hypothetical protein
MEETFPGMAVPGKPPRRFHHFKKAWRVHRVVVDDQTISSSVPSIASVSVEDSKLSPSTNSHTSVSTDESAFEEQEPHSDLIFALVSVEEDSRSEVDPNARSRETELSGTHPSSSRTNMTDALLSPAVKTYDAAKGAWSWGKGVALVAPVFELAQDLAAKVVGKAGTSFEDLDMNAAKLLHALDAHYLNPIVGNLVKAMLGAVASSEDFVKPIITSVMKSLETTIMPQEEAVNMPAEKAANMPEKETTSEAEPDVTALASVEIGTPVLTTSAPVVATLTTTRPAPLVVIAPGGSIAERAGVEVEC